MIFLALMDKFQGTLLVGLLLLATAHCKALNDWPLMRSGMGQTNWTGKWHGSVEAYPEGEIGNGWNLTMEIGIYPTSDNSCTIWKSVMSEHGIVQTTKDYRLCRGCGAENLYIDEGGGVTIGARWINNVLVSPFKYQGVFAISSMRMRGDILEEEILITDDNPAVDGIVVSVPPRSIHLFQLKRVFF